MFTRLTPSRLPAGDLPSRNTQEQEAEAMLDLMNIGSSILPPIPQQIPLLNIKVEDIRIDIEPSPILMLPVIHIGAKLDIKLGF